MTRKIALAAPVMGDEEWLALREPLESGWLTQGPQIARFEKEFAERHGVAHAVAVSSATAGLHVALAALGIGPGDEVIVPAFTWVSAANAVLYCGAEPVLADIDPVTFNLDPAQLDRLLTTRTKAVIAAHLFGLCAEMDAIRARLPGGIALVEDAACAAGAAWRGQPAGGLGDVAVFSFHPRKSITTGEGGMVTTNDAGLAGRAASLRNHGAVASDTERRLGSRPWLMPEVDALGFNYRMTDLQAALGRVQLKKLDRFIDERALWAGWYRERLAGLNWLRTPQEPKDGRHAWQAFVVMVDPAHVGRNVLMERLQDKGIATRPGTHAVHMLAYYRDRFRLRPEDFPAARSAALNSVAIPLHNRMTPDDYDYIVSALKTMA